LEYTVEVAKDKSNSSIVTKLIEGVKKIGLKRV